jgi:hypothetical protein
MWTPERSRRLTACGQDRQPERRVRVFGRASRQPNRLAGTALRVGETSWPRLLALPRASVVFGLYVLCRAVARYARGPEEPQPLVDMRDGNQSVLDSRP